MGGGDEGFLRRRKRDVSSEDKGGAARRPREKASSYLDADLKRALENLTFPPTFRGLHNPRLRRSPPLLPSSSMLSHLSSSPSARPTIRERTTFRRRVRAPRAALE